MKTSLVSSIGFLFLRGGSAKVFDSSAFAIAVAEGTLQVCDLRAMATNLRAMASNLLAMASKLLAMASNLVVNLYTVQINII